ncbi:MAG: DNA primase [Saprospirales bacterium]|nr:DNA primase [Saprospirales bacterium]
MISDRSKQEILEAAKIEEVIGDYVNLKRRGSNLVGLCPFHPEKTPSFAVSPSKNLYKCFGCGKAGDSVTFLMEHEHLTFPEALRFLAGKFGIELEEKEWSPEEKEAREHTESLFLVNDFGLKYFQQQLFETDRGKSVGLSYFKKRGFREEIIRKFGLGFAPDTTDGLTKEATLAGYSLEHLQQLGLTSESQRDFFRNRVVFTIHNQSGKAVGFAGRTLTNDKHSPKYLNSPESEIYHKSKILYGMFFAQRTIRKEEECILVEGYTDVLSLHQAGIENVVASSGTSLTVEQVRLIKRFSPNLKVLYDGDLAGRKAALRGSDLALEQDLNVRVVLLPDGEDPDSYLQKVGAEVFREYLDQNAEDFILYKTASLLEDAGHDPIRRTVVAKDVLSSVARIPDALKRAMYVKECARMLEMEEQSLHSELNKQIRQILQKKLKDQGGEATSGSVARDDIPTTGLSPEDAERLRQESRKPGPPTKVDQLSERDIARILIAYGDQIFDKDQNESVAEYVLRNIEEVMEHFEHALYRQVAELTLERLQNKEPVNTAFFVQHGNDAIRTLAIDLLQSPYEISPGWSARFDVYQKLPDENFFKDALISVWQIKLDKLQRLIEDNINQMKAHQGQEDEMDYVLIHQHLLEQRQWLAERLGTVVPRFKN